MGRKRGGGEVRNWGIFCWEEKEGVLKNKNNNNNKNNYK